MPVNDANYVNTTVLSCGTCQMKEKNAHWLNM